MNLFYIFGIYVFISIGCVFAHAQSLENESKEEIIRGPRSPTKHKPFLGGFLFGGDRPTTHHGPQGVVNNNYITNINNYGHGGPGGGFAESAAIAGGHGAQTQSQAAAFAIGPHGAAFSHSQAQSGQRHGGPFDFFDY